MKRHTQLPATRSILRASFALALAAVLGPVACDSSPEIVGGQGSSCEEEEDCGDGFTCGGDNTCTPSCSSSEDCDDGEFCSSFSVCKSECASCGNSCEETEDCPSGQFCTDEGSCQQECEPDTSDSACPANRCSENGECVSNDSIEVPTGGAGGMSGTDPDENEECIDVEVDFEPQIPNVVLLIDRSGSMNAGNGFGAAVDTAIGEGSYEAWDCDDYDWRYNVVRNVLLNPDRGVVKPLEDSVRFGMALYSSPSSAAEACPQLLEVDLGFGTQQAMLDEFDCNDYLVHTPSRESLTATAEKLADLDIDGPKVIVFATDGEPDNCECRDWDSDYGTQCDSSDSDNDVMLGGEMRNTAEAEQYRVVEEAQRIHDELGITVEVINVSSPGNTSLKAHLDDVAEFGGATSGASIDGFDPGALTDAFESIIDGVRSCAIDLDGMISEGKESTGTVRLDTDPTEGVDFEELELDDPNGWKVNSPTQIELVGDACETIKSGDHELDIGFPCGSFVPPTVQ